jgi:proteasome lid subunit RPN8/RPN11
MAKNPKEEKAKKAPKADKAKKVKKTEETELPDNLLPQNILPMGERVEENKNIYISQRTYKRIRKFTKNKLTNESGGMLIGRVVEEMGKTNIIINGFVEAKYCEATPTTLKFTHETWEYVHSQIDSRYKGRKIVGWIHTHPDFGIFLSEYDKLSMKTSSARPIRWHTSSTPFRRLKASTSG